MRIGFDDKSVVERRSMEILLVGNELGPWLSASDGRDDLTALGKAFKQLGHDVTLAVPYDSAYERGGLLLARRLSPLELPNGHAVVIYDAQLSTGAKVVLFGMPVGADATVRSDASPMRSTLQSVSTFARAIAAYVEQRAQLSQPLDVVHLFDWTTALAGLAIRRFCPSAQSSILLTLRDAPKLGYVTASEVSDIDDELLLSDEARLGGQVCIAKAGMVSADLVLAASEGAIARLHRTTAPADLGPVLSQLRQPLIAVSAGVDYARVNPSTNPSLLSRYDAEDVRNKAANKTEWQRSAKLSLEPRPLFIVPGPLRADNAVERMMGALEPILEHELSLCFLATSQDEPEPLRRLRQLVAGRPSDAAIVEVTQDEQIHRAFAAADFAIYPLHDGRATATHLAAQRYGAIAIADASSPIGERVVDVDAELVTGTGFLFSDATSEGLAGAVARAVTAFHQSQFSRLRRRVMRLDSSWDRPARRLIQLYQKARNGGHSLIASAS